MVALLFAGIRTRRCDGEEPVQQSIYDLPRMQQIANRPQGLAGGLWCCSQPTRRGVIGKVRPGGGNE
jgi:hypothetical protein